MLKDFTFRFHSNPDQVSAKFDSKKGTFYLPDEYHFCGPIYEMEKQVFHTINWYKAHKDQKIARAKYTLKKYKGVTIEQLK